MQQKIEENRRENFENDTCIPIIALGAASYFFIKQGKAQGVCGLTLRMVEEAMMGTFTEDLKCSYIQTSIDICKRHLCFYMKTVFLLIHKEMTLHWLQDDGNLGYDL